MSSCFNGSKDIKNQKKRPIGFGQENVVDLKEYSITPQDLMKIGLERELVGRFNTYIHTNNYNKEALKKYCKNQL